MRSSKPSNTGQEAANLNIVLTGGGSGGHITPLLAVAEELKKMHPKTRLIFIGQKGDKLEDVPKKHRSIDEVYGVRAGKFRRYHGEGLKQILDLKTLLKNIRDFFYLLVGIIQSFFLLGRIKPSVIFIKGGFVGVPVGLAAAVRNIPYLTHDSDAVPGLANRIISRWASAHAVALPKDIYKYPKNKTFTVGVPISSNFQPVTEKLQNKYKRDLKISSDYKVIFITGGGLGAQRLNNLMVNVLPVLLDANPKLFVIHVTGRDHEAQIKSDYKKVLGGWTRDRVVVKGFFVNDLFVSSGAADIVITRAGATNLAEFATQRKACVVVPNPQLTGGHQLKNAEYLNTQGAALCFSEQEIMNSPEVLIGSLQDLLNNDKKRESLGKKLSRFAKPRASKDLAELILEINAKHKK